MKLYLVRHGDYKQDDAQGALSDVGIQEIQQLASFLKRLSVQAENIFHSGKLRAQQTAELLAPSFSDQPNIQQYQGLNPNDDIREFAKTLPVEAEEDTLIVGHMPFMSRLVSFLLIGNENKEIVDFQTGTIVCLDLQYQGQWVIEWILRGGFFI